MGCFCYVLVQISYPCREPEFHWNARDSCGDSAYFPRRVSAGGTRTSAWRCRVFLAGVHNHPRIHEDFVTWKLFPHYWPFVRKIHIYKYQWCGALKLPMLITWIDNVQAFVCRIRHIFYSLSTHGMVYNDNFKTASWHITIPIWLTSSVFFREKSFFVFQQLHSEQQYLNICTHFKTFCDFLNLKMVCYGFWTNLKY